MAIATAVQRGETVYAYDEKDKIVLQKHGELHGFTSGTVSIKWGNTIYTYDDKGRTVSMNRAD